MQIASSVSPQSSHPGDGSQVPSGLLFWRSADEDFNESRGLPHRFNPLGSRNKRSGADNTVHRGWRWEIADDEAMYVAIVSSVMVLGGTVGSTLAQDCMAG